MLDYWGRVTATGPGACVTIGTYIHNPRVKVIINLVIEECHFFHLDIIVYNVNNKLNKKTRLLQKCRSLVFLIDF